MHLNTVQRSQPVPPRVDGSSGDGEECIDLKCVLEVDTTGKVTS